MQRKPMVRAGCLLAFLGVGFVGLMEAVLGAAQENEKKEIAVMSEEKVGLIQRVGHVMLGVRDIEKSVAFYRDRLGLRLLSQNEGFAFFDGGGVVLALSLEIGKAKNYSVGAVEIVLAVDDVHAAHQALSERGVIFWRAPRLVTGQQWSANFTDPDGHELSIFGLSTTR